MFETLSRTQIPSLNLTLIVSRVSQICKITNRLGCIRAVMSESRENVHDYSPTQKACLTNAGVCVGKTTVDENQRKTAA
jgi:hypothetical protein